MVPVSAMTMRKVDGVGTETTVALLADEESVGEDVG